MDKLSLDLDRLNVDSFAPGVPGSSPLAAITISGPPTHSYVYCDPD